MPMDSVTGNVEHVLSKELKLNDSHILKKRTQYFNADLIRNLGTISFILIMISYFNTLSLFDFAIRISQQFIITRPFPKTSTDLRTMSTNVKKLISKSILQMLIVVNLIMIAFHLIFTLNIADKSSISDYSHGGWTLQIIGEKKFGNWFFYKLFILINDILIFTAHSSLYFITCLKNEGLVLEDEVTASDDEQQQEETYDGYSGNTTVIDISPILLLKQASEFRREVDTTTPASSDDRNETGTLSMPGGFEAFSNFNVDDFV